MSALSQAQAAQAQAVALVRVLHQFGVLPAAKAIMRWIGIDCGDPRPPERGLDPRQRQALFDRISEMPVFSRPLQSQHVGA